MNDDSLSLGVPGQVNPLLQSLTAAQYRAKQVETMNPFCTFFNQMQTKNKFHERQGLHPQKGLQADESAVDLTDPRNIRTIKKSEHNVLVDTELIRLIALQDFDQ